MGEVNRGRHINGVELGRTPLIYIQIITDDNYL